MAIEIKELIIRLSVEDSKKDSVSAFPEFRGALDLDKLRKDIVKECTAKVLEKIERKSER